MTLKLVFCSRQWHYRLCSAADSDITALCSAVGSDTTVCVLQEAVTLPSVFCSRQWQCRLCSAAGSDTTACVLQQRVTLPSVFCSSDTPICVLQQIVTVMAVLCSRQWHYRLCSAADSDTTACVLQKTVTLPPVFCSRQWHYRPCSATDSDTHVTRYNTGEKFRQMCTGRGYIWAAGICGTDASVGRLSVASLLRVHQKGNGVLVYEIVYWCPDKRSHQLYSIQFCTLKPLQVFPIPALRKNHSRLLQKKKLIILSAMTKYL